MRDCYLDLFWWMSHVGKGQNQRLLDALEVLSTEQDRKILIGNARTFLRQLRRVGHADRPEGKEHTWVMNSPSLVMRADSTGAFWRGSLDSSFRDQICELAGAYAMFSPPKNNIRPPHFAIIQSEKKIVSIAEKAGISLLKNLSMWEAARVEEISAYVALSNGLPETHRDCLKPIETHFPSEIFVFNPPQSSWKYFAKCKDMTYEVSSKEDAIYFAARNEYVLCDYVAVSNQFECDVRVPLRYEVPLCLCTGRLPKYEEHKFVYSGVPPHLGNYIRRQLGQDHFVPKVFWF